MAVGTQLVIGCLGMIYAGQQNNGICRDVSVSKQRKEITTSHVDTPARSSMTKYWAVSILTRASNYGDYLP